MLMTKKRRETTKKMGRNPGKWHSIVLPCLPRPAKATRNEKLKTNNQERNAPTETFRSPGICSQETAALSASDRRRKIDETRLDRTSPDLTGRNATLRGNSCPSWIAKPSQAPSVRTRGDRATPMQTSDLARTPITRNEKRKTKRTSPPKKKNSSTFGDIWGHLGTYVPLSRQNERASDPLHKGSGRPLCQIHTHANHGSNSRENQDSSDRLRESIRSVT